MQALDFIHPDDIKAIRELEDIPGLKSIMEKLFEYGLDDILWSQNITTNIKLSNTQIPEVYNLLPPICEQLGISVPELYLNNSSIPNSWTSGRKKPYIVVTFGLIRICTPEEITSVLAHECGHIICNHVVYNTLTEAIFTFGEALADGSGGKVINAVALKGIRQSLCAWQRASELSADRVACIVTSADVLIHALAKLERIPYMARKNMDYNAWAEQGAQYEALKNSNAWGKIVRWVANSDMDHPYGPVRAYEAKQWERSRQYGKTLTGKMCPACGSIIDSAWKFCKKCGCRL